LIAGLPKAPNYYSPFKSIGKGKTKKSGGSVKNERFKHYNKRTGRRSEQLSYSDRKNLQEQTAGTIS
jgi:hypothetical protein